MFSCVIYFVCFCLLSLKVTCSPFPSNGLKSSSLALIDCNDLALRKKIEVSKIPYNCIEKSYYSKNIEAPKEEIIIREKVDCRDSKRCRTNLEASLVEICQPDFMFDPTLGECLPIPSIECKEGYSYDSTVGRCTSNSEVYFEQNDEPLKYSSSHKCPSGYVYSSEIDRCQILAKRPAGARLPVASLIKDKPEVSTLVYYEVVGKKKCSKEEVYISEIDICVPYEKPIRSKRFAQSVQSTTERIGKKKCKPGQIYISEIDHCVDNNKENSAEKL